MEEISVRVKNLTYSSSLALLLSIAAIFGVGLSLTQHYDNAKQFKTQELVINKPGSSKEIKLKVDADLGGLYINSTDPRNLDKMVVVYSDKDSGGVGIYTHKDNKFMYNGVVPGGYQYTDESGGIHRLEKLIPQTRKDIGSVGQQP